MRDGVKLATDVYLPEGKGPWTVVLMRTPYNKVTMGAQYKQWTANGYVFAVQDCRGRFESEGEYDTIFQEVADGYDALMFARAVKTETELRLLERATQLNEAAITATCRAWQRGMTWSELSRAYTRAMADRGGFVRDPGGMVWGHPRGSDHAIVLRTSLEDEVIEPGAHVMFDCHGTVDLYCWDGGKTWVVGGEPQGEGKRNLRATAQVAEQLVAEMKPGARPSQLQGSARELYRKAGVADADAAIAFFHGLGLSHMDVEQTLPDGRPNTDWALEDGMVAPVHLLYPGGDLPLPGISSR